MRSKRHIKIFTTENRIIKSNLIVKTMASILQRERQQHQTTILELRNILKDEREQTNIFLKDMKKILDEMESNELNTSLNTIHVIQIIFIFFHCN